VQVTKQQLLDLGDREGQIMVVDGALAFLEYFEKQWINTMDGWSREIRKRAADTLGVTLEKLATTNNHTEGFHSGLKTSQLQR